ncbi:MAG: hypothetical protein WC091_23845, partial [Sulfuricellaceae bacterium]
GRIYLDPKFRRNEFYAIDYVVFSIFLFSQPSQLKSARSGALLLYFSAPLRLCGKYFWGSGLSCLVAYQSSRCIFCGEHIVDQALERLSVKKQ